MAPFKFPINDWDGNGSTDDLFDIFMERKICQNFAPQKEENMILDSSVVNGIACDFSSDDSLDDGPSEEMVITLEFECESDYDWRDDFKDVETYGVSPYDYNTLEEFIEAYNKAEEQHFQKLADEHDKEMKAFEEKRQLELELKRQQERKADLTDSKEYIYCGVKFDENSCVFHYITDDESVVVGDNVLVPVGCDNNETPAVVVSVKKYLRINAPYPFAKTKKIIKKV